MRARDESSEYGIIWNQALDNVCAKIEILEVYHHTVARKGDYMV